MIRARFFVFASAPAVLLAACSGGPSGGPTGGSSGSPQGSSGASGSTGNRGSSSSGCDVSGCGGSTGGVGSTGPTGTSGGSSAATGTSGHQGTSAGSTGSTGTSGGSSAATGTSGSSGGGSSTGAACQAGQPCTPTNPCDLGSTACSAGQSACQDVGPNAAANGQGCGGGNVCENGTCAPCQQGASCVPANPCHDGSLDCASGSCQDTGAFAAAGLGCGGGVCDGSGHCQAGCWIGGALVPTATIGDGGCTSCQPATSPSSWTNLPDGTACGAIAACAGGVCQAGCTINGTFYPDQTPNPADACQGCAVAASTTAWSRFSGFVDAGGWQTQYFTDWVVSADFNGDGFADLAAATEVSGPPAQAYVEVGLNDGRGNMAPSVAYPGRVSGAALIGLWPPIVTANFSGTGPGVGYAYEPPDNTSVQSLDFLPSAGGGTLGAMVEVPGPTVVDPNAAGSTFANAPVTGRFGPSAADDVVVVGEPQPGGDVVTVVAFQNDGAGSFTAQPPEFLDAGSVTGGVYFDLATADMNGDGKPDLVAGAAGGGVAILLGQGGDRFGAPAFYPSAGYSGFVVSDLNGDGLPDVATYDYGQGAVYLLYNQGAGVLGTPLAVTGLPTTTTTEGFLAAGDFNGDGAEDILYGVATTSTDVATFAVLFNQSGVFAPSNTFQLPVSSPFYAPPIVADLHHSGRLDLVTATTLVNSGVQIWTNICP